MCISTEKLRGYVDDLRIDAKLQLRDTLLEESVRLGSLWGVKYARELNARFSMEHLYLLIETGKGTPDVYAILLMIVGTGVVPQPLPSILIEKMLWGVSPEMENLLFKVLYLPGEVHYARALRCNNPTVLQSCPVTLEQAVREVFRLAVTRGPEHLDHMSHMQRLQPGKAKRCTFQGALNVLIEQLSKGEGVPWVVELLGLLLSIVTALPSPNLELGNAIRVASQHRDEHPELPGCLQQMVQMLPTPRRSQSNSPLMGSDPEASARGMSPYAAEFTPETMTLSLSPK